MASKLSEEALLRELPAPIAANIRDLAATGYDPDQIGALMVADPVQYLGVRSLGRVPADLRMRLKVELDVLVCTDDSKYQDVRVGLGKESQVAGAVVLSL